MAIERMYTVRVIDTTTSTIARITRRRSFLDATQLAFIVVAEENFDARLATAKNVGERHNRDGLALVGRVGLTAGADLWAVVVTVDEPSTHEILARR